MKIVQKIIFLSLISVLAHASDQDDETYQQTNNGTGRVSPEYGLIPQCKIPSYLAKLRCELGELQAQLSHRKVVAVSLIGQLEPVNNLTDRLSDRVSTPYPSQEECDLIKTLSKRLSSVFSAVSRSSTASRTKETEEFNDLSQEYLKFLRSHNLPTPVEMIDFTLLDPDQGALGISEVRFQETIALLERREMVQRLATAAGVPSITLPKNLSFKDMPCDALLPSGETIDPSYLRLGLGSGQGASAGVQDALSSGSDTSERNDTPNDDQAHMPDSISDDSQTDQP